MIVAIHPAYSQAKDFIETLPSVFDTAGKLVYQGRNAVRSFDTPWGEWMVKAFKKPHLIQRIAYTFWRPSKPQRAFKYAQRLLQMGIPTPEGIAYIEIKEGGLFSKGYFVSAALHDPSLYDVLNRTENFDRRLADCVADFVVDMHVKGFLHGDLNLSNILYHPLPTGGYRFSVIDTNRSTFNPNASPAECIDRLKRLTHRRDLLNYLVGVYARKRNWDEAATVHEVNRQLVRFETKKKWLHKLKGTHPGSSSR